MAQHWPQYIAECLSCCAIAPSVIRYSHFEAVVHDHKASFPVRLRLESALWWGEFRRIPLYRLLRIKMGTMWEKRLYNQVFAVEKDAFSWFHAGHPFQAAGTYCTGRSLGPSRRQGCHRDQSLVSRRAFCDGCSRCCNLESLVRPSVGKGPGSSCYLKQVWYLLLLVSLVWLFSKPELCDIIQLNHTTVYNLHKWLLLSSMSLLLSFCLVCRIHAHRFQLK